MIFACIFILLVSSAVAFFIYKKGTASDTQAKKGVFSVVAILLLCIGLECSLFNINYYSSRDYEAFSLKHYLSDRQDSNGEYTVLSENEIEFSELNKEIKNIKITPSATMPQTVQVTVHLTDQANQYYYSTPTRTIYRDVEKSHYININSIGSTQNLRLVFNSGEYILKLQDISVNEARPFDFSVARVVILFAILLLLYLFKPSSLIYEMKLCEAENAKYNIRTLLCALLCIVFIVIGTLNPLFIGLDYTENGVALAPLSMQHHNQYDELAQAILQGKTYIDNNDIPASLLEMENPYDTTARMQQQNLSGDQYRWDVAFFNGHYYVYFGIVPLLLMYLPCRAILDAPFPTAFGIIFFAFIFALGVFMLLELIATKYFRKISLGTYLLTSFAFIFCCGTMFLVKRPDFYSLPIICAMTFVVWGLYFWLKGIQTQRKQALYFLLGSFCMALSVGCRPQSVLMCALALPIFADFFFKDKYILTSKGIKNLVTLAVPFVFVASGIMYYNFIRFGSPFDFGSGYNLTTNDVTSRGFDISRTGLGLFTYLFQTPKLVATFPFIENVEISTAYVGKTIYELCFGGIITCTPVLWFLFCFGKAKASLKENKLLGVTAASIFVAIATVIADTQAGGLLQRYFSDFGYILFLAATIVIFALVDKNIDVQSTKNLHSLLFISTIFSVLYTLCLVFSVADVTIDITRPQVFGYVKHMVEFWL